MRKLHVGFLVGFIMVLGLCGGGTYLLHRVQMLRHASSLLDRARSAEAGGNLTRAEESLSLYLGLKRDDSSAWTWYARITDERTKNPRGRERVFLVNEEALRKNPDDRKLERRCAELAIELERHNDARRHLIHLNEAIQADPEKAAEAAELEDLLGQCDQPESNFDEAERHYRKSIALDPTRVVTFDRLARLLRQDVKQPEAANRAIEEMLKANPKSALAHVNRWRYRREVGPAADGGDIALSLKLGPDEAEVLVAAAELARQSKRNRSGFTGSRRGGATAQSSIPVERMILISDCCSSSVSRSEEVATNRIPSANLVTHPLPEKPRVLSEGG
jgi:tetratricopeptide (TPR) repeat protein